MFAEQIAWLPKMVLVILAYSQETGAGLHESRLIEMLLNPSLNTAERPAENDSQPLRVEFMITMQQIIDVDEKNQVIHTNLWQTIKWTDYKFRWNPEEFGNITDIRLPLSKVWKPDILMYNSAGTTFDGSYPTNVVVYHDGQMEQIPPGLFTSSCPIEIKWFPFDDQKCTMKFGSWTYDGSKIDLVLPEGKDSASIDGFAPNGEWNLIAVPASRNVVMYDCCPNNPYYDITFTLHIRRRKLYYMVNIVAPCMMLSSLTLLTFLIPPDAGEKISFGVTILLSLTVFLLLVAEALPATSDAIPLVALYFSSVMLLNALSVLFTVLVLCYHFRTGSRNVMPAWVNHGICHWLAWILRMKRPGFDLAKELRRPIAAKRQDVEMADRSKEEQEQEETELTGSPPMSPLLSDCYSTGSGACSPLLKTTSPRFSARPNFSNAYGSTERDFEWFSPRAGSANGGVRRFSATQYELQAILKEIRYVTARFREDDRADSVTTDWKFASAVIDRLLLVLFTVVTIVSTFCILFAAPNFFESS